MSSSPVILALDVGEARIGVASADTTIRIPVPRGTLVVDGTEHEQLAELIAQEPAVHTIVLGFPRNQSGQTTAQTEYVKHFSEQLQPLHIPIVFQDESLTSVLAEERLRARQKVYSRADIDAEAAVIILQDYLEAQYGY